MRPPTPSSPHVSTSTYDSAPANSTRRQEAAQTRLALPVRTAPGDRYLTDDDWAEVARRIVHATGLTPGGDDQACRWIAVQHADDHIHILASNRARCSAIRADQEEAAALRSAARELLSGNTSTDGAVVVDLTVAAIYSRWHEKRGHEQQAAAAEQTPVHLRVAYAATAQPVLTDLARRAPRQQNTDGYAAAVRQALAEHAERLLTAPAWPDPPSRPSSLKKKPLATAPARSSRQRRPSVNWVPPTRQPKSSPGISPTSRTSDQAPL
ncbi:hypothetical protein CU044_0483 [Streptomyces sp. L-9-10]|nr:hypothetical protein CU044_0483 [Streptomyces sp. L-9-10]